MDIAHRRLLFDVSSPAPINRRLAVVPDFRKNMFDPPVVPGYDQPCRRAPMPEVAMNSSRRVLNLAVLLVLLESSSIRAAEIRLPRHPDYSEGRIAFSYLGDLWLVNDDGANPRRLTTHAARDSHPRFSPDGKWIAYVSDRSGEYHLHLIGADGRTPDRQLTTDGRVYRFRPVWSPDSKKLLFSDQTGRLHWVAVADGKFQTIDKSEYGDIGDYAWSADSRWVAYVKGTPSYFGQIHLYSTRHAPDGGGDRRPHRRLLAHVRSRRQVPVLRLAPHVPAGVRRHGAEHPLQRHRQAVRDGAARQHRIARRPRERRGDRRRRREG